MIARKARLREVPFGLKWSDVMYNEGVLAVRAKLKGGKMRYVPVPPELADLVRVVRDLRMRAHCGANLQN